MHPAWGPYPDTVLHFPEAGLNVDLRQVISPHTRVALARLGLEGPFALVTACNPRGAALPVSLEEARELAARFFQMGVLRFDGDRFFIEPVLAPQPALALPAGAASV